ncbi:hypothetical protein FGG08_001950 [Glutinoglossum americanum]|uniref:CENP-T/Histone H4 histone fold domain-containing protein n=1 Tax=Glutinoglossum americanum TaxID=1670608 RepID=A0A9P8L4W6_9PEZI|nr:hypothetical protein FGG08_001950 [Glutinoglossum americanum]
MSSTRRRGGLRRSSVSIPIEEAVGAEATTDIASVTPRNTSVNEMVGAASQETPYTNLRQLAGLIHKPSTPQQRASSAGPPSARRSARRTPSAQGRTPRGAGALRPVPSRRTIPTTPHAVRALQQRRAAAITPGRDRRRSGRGIRDSPRDVLRGLSRILARDTQPIEPSPQLEKSSRRVTLPNDDLDIGPELPAPRFSLPLDDDDDDSFHLHPPRLSAPFEEENYTQQSVELPRRVNLDQSGGRLSRGSFGSIRTSDRFADINELGLGALSEDGGDESLARPEFDDYGEDSMRGESGNLDENTQDLQQAFHDETSTRHSDIIPVAVTEEQDDTTFVFSFPRSRDIVETSAFVAEPGGVPQLSPEPEQSLPELDLQYQSGGMATAAAKTESRPTKSRSKTKKIPKLSQHGIPYPSLPSQVVKKLASTFARASGNGKTVVTKEALAAIMQASDWFFEQLSDDLGTYAKHAHRKTIDETDMLTLMKRQRQVNSTTTSFSLAQRYLPRELLQDIRMNLPVKISRSRLQHSDAVDEQDDE